MQEAEVCVPSDRRIGAPNYGSAARELQNVLSRRLPSFYKIAYRLLGNAADAEDAVQDALLAAHKHLGQFRGQSQMSTLLSAIAHGCNCVGGHAKSTWRWMSGSGTSNTILCWNDWRTVGALLRMSAEFMN